MFTGFWGKIEEEIASNRSARILLLPFTFWAVGLVSWIWVENRWQQVSDYITLLHPTLGVALLVAMLILVALSGGAVRWAGRLILRFTEGYWPTALNWLKRIRLAWLLQNYQKKTDQWQKLAQKYKDLDSIGLEKYVRLEVELSDYPSKGRFMPTRLGNKLRAAEDYPYERYGLETVTTWPRLWLVLPESTRSELSSTRQRLDERTQLMTWGMLLLIWAIFTLWIIPIALIVVWVSYQGMLEAASVYGDLLRSAFDNHRFLLYTAFHWPLPLQPSTEKECGQVLTQYIQHGAAGISEINFTHSEN